MAISRIQKIAIVIYYLMLCEQYLLFWYDIDFISYNKRGITNFLENLIILIKKLKLN